MSPSIPATLDDLTRFIVERLCRLKNLPCDGARVGDLLLHEGGKKIADFGLAMRGLLTFLEENGAIKTETKTSASGKHATSVVASTPTPPPRSTRLSPTGSRPTPT